MMLNRFSGDWHKRQFFNEIYAHALQLNLGAYAGIINFINIVYHIFMGNLFINGWVSWLQLGLCLGGSFLSFYN